LLYRYNAPAHFGSRVSVPRDLAIKPNNRKGAEFEVFAGHATIVADGPKVDWRRIFVEREAFLTVSGQLNVEAYCLAQTKVYTYGPTTPAATSPSSG
jgi:aspartyl/asparaginyl-tRNA synthetase